MLQTGVQEGAKPMTLTDGLLDNVIAKMTARAQSNKGGPPSKDQQLEAVRRFWDGQEITQFRDAYLLSWGLCLPHRPSAPCILEDRPRLQRVLNGVDEWKSHRAYRRCYQGLVKSYFTYDGMSPSTAPDAKNNWQFLRDYLAEHNGLLRTNEPVPEWVDIALGNRHLFSERPCEPYIEVLLRGDSSAVDHVCILLGIAKASWFLRELVLAQVVGATKLDDKRFLVLLPRLLDLLSANEVLRDRGMIQVLNRYTRIPGKPLHQGLRDLSVASWRNPWLPSSNMCWGGVVPEARAMVEEWLKLEFIEAFFTKLAEDGLGDPRRMNFWKRYVKAIRHIDFALGSTARYSRDKDMATLREKMQGIVRELEATDGKNNAFIMTIGKLVAVEFSGMGNALYGYDLGHKLPFDVHHPLRLGVNDRNSLKHKGKNILWLSHQDGIHNWDKWEQMFEATLRKEFSIEPDAIDLPRTPHPAAQKPSAAAAQRAFAPHVQPYSRSELSKFCRERLLQIDDKTASGGNLWVRTDSDDNLVSQTLTGWQFRHKPGKGWWR
jgi:hypothetical protein